MGKMAEYAFVAGTLSTVLALIGYLFYAVSGLRAARMATAGVSMTTTRVGFVSGPRTASIGHYASLLAWLGFFCLGASLIFRTVATGHGPFANMYEFSIAFAFGILGAYSGSSASTTSGSSGSSRCRSPSRCWPTPATVPATHRAARPGAPEQHAPDDPRRLRDRRLRLVHRSPSPPRSCT